MKENMFGKDWVMKGKDKGIKKIGEKIRRKLNA